MLRAVQCSSWRFRFQSHVFAASVGQIFIENSIIHQINKTVVSIMQAQALNCRTAAFIPRKSARPSTRRSVTVTALQSADLKEMGKNAALVAATLALTLVSSWRWPIASVESFLGQLEPFAQEPQLRLYRIRYIGV